jgi:hypothetical protein
VALYSIYTVGTCTHSTKKPAEFKINHPLLQQPTSYSPLTMAVLESHKGYYLWKYIPSLAGAAAFVFLFAAATLAHSYRIYKTKAKFCLSFTIGCLCVCPPCSNPTHYHTPLLDLIRRKLNSYATPPAHPHIARRGNSCPISSKCLHPRRAGAVRCLDIHDARTHHLRRERGTIFVDTS